jgi:DNA polymerase-1
MSKQAISLDTETFLFEPYNMAPRVVCLSWAAKRPGPSSMRSVRPNLIVNPDEIERWLHEHLDAAIEGRAILSGHVVAYDMACILKTFPSVWEKVWRAYDADGLVCTAVRERLLDIAMNEFGYYYDNNGKQVKTEYHLAEIVKRWTGRELAKGEDTWRLRYGELYGVPQDQWPKEAVEYALSDAQETLNIYLDQEKRAKGIGYSIPTQFEDSRADFALRLASVWGVEPDSERVEKLWNGTVSHMESLVEPLVHGGFVRSVNRRKSMEDLFTKAQRAPMPELTKSLKAIRGAIQEHWPGGSFGSIPKTEKGSIQTGMDVLQRCDHYEPFKHLIKFNELQKLASTYISKLFEPIIHARFDAVGSISDRTSCSGPNLQNQVEETRNCIKARPGTVFLACDFDSQEMRTLAQSCLDICGHSRLAERYQKDRAYDPHLEFASLLAGVSVEKARAELEAGDERIKSLRQQSKVANFGFPGGMGFEKFVLYARGWGLKDLTEGRARELKDAWFRQWPEMRTYFEHVQNLIGEASHGTLTVPQSGFRRGGCGYSDASNGYFQALAAHASKAAMYQVSKKCYVDRDSYLYGSRPVLFIHDEIILETPEEAGDQAAQEMQHVLIEAMERWTPDIPAAASATLMRYWAKKAERVFDKSGKLIPWEDR